jgi:hypothetical protein
MASQCSLEGFHTTYSMSLNPSTAGLCHERIKMSSGRGFPLEEFSDRRSQDSPGGSFVLSRDQG